MDFYRSPLDDCSWRNQALSHSPPSRTSRSLTGPVLKGIDAGLSADICCHTFRATGITAYLENGGTLENAQLMAAHESPRTTKLYDRTGGEITLDEVERIVI
jgi:integrase